jgi:diadenosine tetraphosphate (Ap4A) HIT family hydrolase
MPYNHANIFARIIKGEIPCNKMAEGPYFLAFHDLHPKAPVHVLVIPKGPYVDAHHFHTTAPEHAILGFYKGISQTIAELGVAEKGYRLISNAGEHGQQEVPHYHVHILAGRQLGAQIVAH